MLHNSTSILAFARTLIRQDRQPSVGQDYCICIICDCVPRNFCRTYESENSVCPPSPGSCTVPRAPPPTHRSSPAPSLFLFKELYRSHFAPGSCFSEPLAATRDAPAELEAIPSPPFSALLRLYLVRTSLFLLAPCPFKGKKEYSKRSVHPAQRCCGARVFYNAPR
jgi:hypothetical protein